MKNSETKTTSAKLGYWLINGSILVAGLGFIISRIKTRLDAQQELDCFDADYIALASMATLLGISFNTLYHNPVQMTDAEAEQWSKRFLPPTKPHPPLPTPQMTPENHKNILEKVFEFVLEDR